MGELRSTSFEAAAAEHVLAPLGMAGSTFLEAPADRRLQGYTRDGSGTERAWSGPARLATGLVEPTPDYPYNRRHAGSSTLNSSLEDMSRWVSYFTDYQNQHAAVLEPHRAAAAVAVAPAGPQCA